MSIALGKRLKKLYYYHDGENEVGPFKASKLIELEKSGLIGAGTLVRAADEDAWRPFNQLDPEETSTWSNTAEAEADRSSVTPPLRAVREAEPSREKQAKEFIDSNSASVEIEAAKPGTSSFGWLANPPTPWRRYGARMLDTSFNGTVVFFLFGTAFYAIAPAAADDFFSVFESENARFLDILLTTIFASLLGGLLIGASGLTLGKWIFGIKVTKLNESKLGIGAGLKRDFTVLLKGLGLGIPIVALFTMWSAYGYLNKNKSTTWDEGNFIVWHRPSGTSQYILNVIGILLIFLFVGGLTALGNM